MAYRLRDPSKRQRPGRYREEDGPTSANRPIFVHPDVEFNASLTSRCAFPSLPVDHDGPGPSELWRQQQAQNAASSAQAGATDNHEPDTLALDETAEDSRVTSGDNERQAGEDNGHTEARIDVGMGGNGNNPPNSGDEQAEAEEQNGNSSKALPSAEPAQKSAGPNRRLVFSFAPERSLQGQLVFHPEDVQQSTHRDGFRHVPGIERRNKTPETGEPQLPTKGDDRPAESHSSAGGSHSIGDDGLPVLSAAGSDLPDPEELAAQPSPIRAVRRAHARFVAMQQQNRQGTGPSQATSASANVNTVGVSGINMLSDPFGPVEVPNPPRVSHNNNLGQKHELTSLPSFPVRAGTIFQTA
jgi:hypothetical protein